MVKIAASVFIAAALASSAFAHDFAGASSTDEVIAREITDQVSSSLFSRAAVKFVRNMFTRDELSSILERDIADGEVLSARDIEELIERDIDLEEFIARQGASGSDAGDGSDAGAGAGDGTPKPPPAPASKPPVPVHAAPETEGAISKAIAFFATLFRGPQHKVAHPASSKPAPTPHPPTPAPAPAGDNSGDSQANLNEGREMTTMLEEPITRSFEEEDMMMEREFDNSELEQREVFDEDFEQREFDEDLEQREVFDEDLEQREIVDEDMYERDFEDVEDIFERAFSDLDELD